MQNCKLKKINIYIYIYIKAVRLLLIEHPKYFKTNAQQLDTSKRHASKLYIPQCGLAMLKKPSICYNNI